MKKFRPGFLRELWVLVFPIVIQNLIASAVSMADVVMLGRVDQLSLSASSLAGQVQFLLNVVYFGLNSALTILSAQYWGKRDGKTISKIFGLGLMICMSLSVLAFILAVLTPGFLMHIWTDDPELIHAGSRYLRFAACSYLFAGLSQPYLSIMKSCERVRLSMVVSGLTLLLNVCLNAILIFGLVGFPAMGIEGAALATSLAQGVGLAICIYDFAGQKLIPRSPLVIFAIPGALFNDFVKYSLPAFINDALWGLAFNMNSIIMGHLGTDIVAANSMVTVTRDLVTTVGFGISAAASIMLGKEIGEGRMQTAREDASSILRVTLLTGIVGALVLLGLAPLIPGFVRLSETATHYLRIMLLINTVYQMGQLINTLLIASLFRCGGDSRYGMILDLVTMWFVAVPLGLIGAFVLRLPPIIVYLLMCTDEFVKMPFALRHYFKSNWIRNLTREF